MIENGVDMNKKILIVDDQETNTIIFQELLEDHYVLSIVNSGEQCLENIHHFAPDVVVLDIMMPGLDGYETCRRIKQDPMTKLIQVILVSSKASVDSRLEGYDAGADDYVTKPFSAKELAARVRSVLRRTKMWDERPEPAFQRGELVIDFARHMVTLDNQNVNLTAIEYKLLSYLARNADRVVTPDQILEKVWGEDYLGETHLLQVNIGRLRKKLQDDARSPGYILTKLGIGYTMGKLT